MKNLLLMIICSATVFAANVVAAPSNEPLDPAINAAAHKIYDQVLSPFCAGRLLSDCPSQASADLKREIYQKLENGQSPDSVIQDLYVIYGAKIKAVPGHSGFDLVAWLAPLFFFVGGGVLLAIWLKRHRFNTVTPADEVPLSPEMQRKIDDLVQDEDNSSAT